MTDEGIPTHAEAEERMRELIANGGLADPDEVRYEFDPDEVVFLWREPKLAVIVELTDGDHGGTAEDGDGAGDAIGPWPPPA